MEITDEEYQALIERAVQLSMTEQHGSGVRRHDLEDSEDDDFKQVLQRSQTDRSVEDRDEEVYKMALKASEAEHENKSGFSDDEELRKAIEASQVEQNQGNNGDDDEELRRAIEESERAHKEELALKSEEDIVMEFVKKQSLAEDQYRKARGKGKYANYEDDDDDEDEELKRALEESLQTDSSKELGGRGGPSRF